MQKKLIALAVAGLMSSVAFAQSSVTVSGRADAGYQFKRTANADSATGGSNGGKTTETQADGNHGTTELWVRGKEQVNSWLEAGAELNMRYAGGLHEGKTGMGSNDRKSMYLKFPFATVQWGVANPASGEYKLSTKPYAGILGEWEGVKWGVSQLNESLLSNRNTTVWTDPNLLKFGPVALLFKGTFIFGDKQKDGTNADDTAAQSGSGNVRVVGTEFSLFDKRVTGGFDISDRESTAFASNNKNGMTWTHTYVSGQVIPKVLKLGVAYNTYKGYVAAVTGANPVPAGAFDNKTWSTHANFVVSPSLELGLTYSRYNDMGTANTRNSGEGWMLGANYFVSKSTIAYVGVQKTDFESNTVVNGIKYDGTAGGFTANVNKIDERFLRVGVRKNF